MENLYFSRKILGLGILSYLFLFVGLNASAQIIFSEHRSSSSDNSAIDEHYFNADDYTKVMDLFGHIEYQKNKLPLVNINYKDVSTTNVNLSLNFNFDTSEYFVSSILIFNETGYLQTFTYNDFTNPLLVSIPIGIYDIITEFQPLDDSDKIRIVIKEQQNLQSNSTLQIAATEAINYISTTAYDENGNILQPEAGAGGYIFFQRLLYYNPLNLATLGDYYFLVDPFGNQDPTWNFYVNTVSNRYSIIQTLKGNGFDVGNYFSKFETISEIDAAVSIANDPANWSYHTEKFQATLLADNTIAPAYFTASTYNGNLIAGWETSSGGIINPGEDPFRAYLNNPFDGDPVQLVVIPGIIDKYVSYSPTTGGISYYTKGNPVFSDGNGGVLYGSGDISSNDHSDPNYEIVPFLSDDYYLVEGNNHQLLPLHPKFSFDNLTTPSVILGDNVPITITGFSGNKFKIEKKGRYGETRETDYLASQLEIHQNGNVIYSGTYKDFQNSNLPTSGEIEIVLTTSNTMVEDLQGNNTTIINYTAGENDAPPTLQHLQFRNVDAQVTNIFDSIEGATLRLAAGDFKFNPIDGLNGYYTFIEGNSLLISYSVHDQNDWITLSLTEFPEFFQMTAFGNYYEASLSNIQNQNDNSWYDLKVICTDASGNIQEQKISPAFKINESVLNNDNAKDSNLMVYPNPFKNRLNILLPESVNGTYTFMVTDLIGRIVYNKSQNDKLFSWDGSYLSSGVYIFSIEIDGKSITKKVIKI